MFKIKLIFYGCKLQFSQFVWALSYSVWDVFNNFLIIDATDRSKFSGDQKRFFIALSLYPLSFFANTPFKGTVLEITLHLKAACLIHKALLKLLSDEVYEEYCRFPCLKCLILTIFTIVSAWKKCACHFLEDLSF